MTDQVFPPSMVRMTVPLVPLAQMVFVLTTLSPRKPAVVSTLTGSHIWAARDVVNSSRAMRVFMRLSVMQFTLKQNRLRRTYKTIRVKITTQLFNEPENPSLMIYKSKSKLEGTGIFTDCA